MDRGRRHGDLRIWAASLGMLFVLTTGAVAQQQQPSGVSTDPFYALAKEQSLAEGYVVLLETVGKDDIRRYADGIRLYAGAKAEFDGLIEQIKQDVIQGVRFEHSGSFQVVLKNAVAQRIAFTQHVDEAVEEVGTVRPGVKDYIAGAGELLSALTDAAKAIWDSYWTVQAFKRQETVSQLDALKWKNFHEIVKPAG